MFRMTAADRILEASRVDVEAERIRGTLLRP